jgi:rod shape-determining protein MreD
VSSADAAKIAALVSAAAVVQSAVVGSMDVASGAPDLLLVVVVCVALQRGAIAGATAGFLGGLLVDTAALDTLGFTSLLLTLTGYWVGRYGETTGRGRPHAPLLSAAAATIVYEVCAYALHFLLGDDVAARMLGESLAPALLFNVLLTVPVYALCRRILPPARGALEVRLLG